MFDDIIGREGMIESAKDYGLETRNKISHMILNLVKIIEGYSKDLVQIKTNQERWYPFVGLTIEELEEFKDYLEKQVIVFRHGGK